MQGIGYGRNLHLHNIEETIINIFLPQNKRRDPTFLEGIMNALGAGDDEKAKGSENEIKMKGGKASKLPE